MPDAGEGVGRHVERVRGVRRDLRVAPGRLQALLGEGWVVVGVDQVVRHAGMVGVLVEQRLQDLRRPQLVGIGPVRGVEVRRGDERVQDGRFHVLRIGGGDLAHLLLEGRHARRVLKALPVAHKGLHRGHVAFLARIVEAGSAGVLQSRGDGVELLGRQAAGPQERVVEHDHGAPPVGHAAGGVLLGDGLERFARMGPRKGMVERHRAVEVLLHGLSAGHGELDGAEPVAQDMLVLGLLGRGRLVASRAPVATSAAREAWLLKDRRNDIAVLHAVDSGVALRRRWRERPCWQVGGFWPSERRTLPMARQDTTKNGLGRQRGFAPPEPLSSRVVGRMLAPHRGAHLEELNAGVRHALALGRARVELGLD